MHVYENGAGKKIVGDSKLKLTTFFLIKAKENINDLYKTQHCTCTLQVILYIYMYILYVLNGNKHQTTLI